MADISRRESSALINSLTAGVVPRIGLRHIAVGRQKEVTAFLQDLQTISEGGAGFRTICGAYGSGKSFLLQLIRLNATERDFVVADADLSPERRLTGTKGQGISTYRELMQHLSTAARPEGGALEAVLQKWISRLQAEAIEEKQLTPGDPALVDAVSAKISAVLVELSEMMYGYSFASVIDSYWRGIVNGDDSLKMNALRWIRGEFSTKTDARQALNVDTIIDDQNWYEFLKLFARFVTKAGYCGLLIFLDEGVNLYKINNRQSRESNYEKLLAIFNDTMQGKAQYIGFFLSGTPQFVYDEQRGLFSYEALRTRLAESQFAVEGYTDYTSPVIKLNRLTNEEIYLLLERLCHLHAIHYGYTSRILEEELALFMNTVAGRLGADKMLTPREVTRDFLGVLNILYQQLDLTMADLLTQKDVRFTDPQTEPPEDTPDDFAAFDL